MNTEIENQPAIVALPSPAAADPIFESRRQRRGKVAQLPKATREKINTMIEDGVPLTKILEQLGDEVKGITISNLSNWHLGGYKEWLRRRDYADALRDRQEMFLDAVGDNPVKLADAGMQIAATGICELLDELSRPESKDENLSDRYARITNSMTRLARVILAYEERREKLAEKQNAQRAERDPNRPFGDEKDTHAVVNIVDKVLGLGRYTPQWIQDLPTSDYASAAAADSSSSSSSSANDVTDRVTSPASPSVPVSESPCTSVTDETTGANSSEGFPSPNSSIPQPSTNNPQPTPKWIPVDQRPWNWQEINEFAYMSRFPPDDYVPEPLNSQPSTLN